MSAKPEIVVIGTSTGGLAALKQIVSGLPDDFPVAVLITMHIGSHESILPDILLPYSPLPVRHANDDEPIRPGTILIAPPDHHLVVERGRVLLSHGPKENFSRPAIDPLFRTAAAAYRDQAVGVILTGNLDDGTVGLQAIKAYGGTAIVQDPEEAEAPSMPLSAMQYTDIDFCLTLDGIVNKLAKLVSQPTEQPKPEEKGDGGKGDGTARWVQTENQFLSNEDPGMETIEKIANLSPFTCPECHGALLELEGALPQRFRCHTGHAFTVRSLAAAQEQVAEEAIWAAVRALHEKESLLRRFEKRASEDKHFEAATEHAAAAERARLHAQALRQMACR